MLSRKTATPSQFSTRQRLVYAIASEFQCGSSTTARRPRAGNQRAFARLFSGYGVRTGEVNRRKLERGPQSLASCFGAGAFRVLKTCTSRRSKRKSEGAR